MYENQDPQICIPVKCRMRLVHRSQIFSKNLKTSRASVLIAPSEDNVDATSEKPPAARLIMLEYLGKGIASGLGRVRNGSPEGMTSPQSALCTNHPIGSRGNSGCSGLRHDVELGQKRVTKILGYFVNKAIRRAHQCHCKRHRSSEEMRERHCDN